MKLASKISLVLNAALAGALIFLWLTARNPRAASAVLQAAKMEPFSEPAQAQTAPPVRRELAITKPFHWSQLVNTNNYRTFVANLRAAGCPEPTIEDIVRGDIGRVYLFKRSELRLNETAPGPWSVQSQNRLVAYMLGQAPSETIAVLTPKTESQPVASAVAKPQSDDLVPGLAAFLQNADLSTPGLNHEQEQRIAYLRQSLLAQITRPNQLAGAASTQASPTEPDGIQSSGDQIADAPPATDNAQPSGATDNTRPFWRPLSQRTLMALQAESMVGGLFGMGAAMSYDQYQAAQASQQSQQH